MKALGYARTSTQRQDLGLDVQERRISLECELRGWEVELISEKVSGSTPPLQRAGLSRALEDLRFGRADALIVAKLDRVARSLTDISLLLEASKQEGWSFIALDLGVDTSTAEGTLVVGIMASIAQWERARIQERTREALAQAAANGTKLGRPRLYNEKVEKHATLLYKEGMSFAQVSRALYKRGIKSTKGRPLSRSTIFRMIQHVIAQEQENDIC